MLSNLLLRKLIENNIYRIIDPLDFLIGSKLLFFLPVCGFCNNYPFVIDGMRGKRQSWGRVFVSILSVRDTADRFHPHPQPHSHDRIFARMHPNSGRSNKRRHSLPHCTTVVAKIASAESVRSNDKSENDKFTKVHR